jgi:hypothetical protein
MATKPIRVSVEFGVTIAVTQDPPQFARIYTSEEAWVYDPTPEKVRKERRRLMRECKRFVDREGRKMKEMFE